MYSLGFSFWAAEQNTKMFVMCFFKRKIALNNIVVSEFFLNLKQFLQHFHSMDIVLLFLVYISRPSGGGIIQTYSNPSLLHGSLSADSLFHGLFLVQFFNAFFLIAVFF